MTIVNLSVGVTSVQSAKPDYAYGSTMQQFPIKSSEALGLLRATIPASIPKTATITSAKLRINQFDGPWTGSVTLTALRHTAPYDYKVTWTTRPAATTTASQSKSNAAAATWWEIDVTADVQAFVAGTQVNYGWRLATNSTTLHKMRTHRADASQPVLVVEYEVAPRVPTDLSPQGGAVSVAEPVLTFQVGSGTTAIQVQVDPGFDAVSPDFDSGEVAAVAGVLDLSATAYAGLSDGSTTYWRARAKSAYGWSGWSAWVEFSRTDLESLSVTAPSGTVNDGTPPFTWTFGGTQTAWQATLLDAAGKVLADSGVVSGTDSGWTPPRGLTSTGQTGTARVRVWDDVDRVATQGAPVYVEDSESFTFAASGTVGPMSTLAATQVRPSPAVVLAGTRATGGVPDEVIVFRDGVQVARFPGTDIFTSSTAFSYTDWSAPMGVESTYLLSPVVNSVVASGGPTADVTPRCDGIWLVNPDTGTYAVLWDVQPGSWDATDVATVHVPVSENASGVVRRRLRRGVLSGSISGQVFDGLGIEAADVLAALDAFAADDAGVTYQLVAGNLSIPVIVGDILAAPMPQSGARSRSAVSFNFWSQ